MSTSQLTGALRETLALFEGPGGYRPQTTAEVADQLGVGRRSTYDRLERLTEAGHLESKKVGASGRIWWRPPTPSPAPDGTVERFQTILETIDDGVYVLDADYRFVYVNDAYVEMTGYDREELLGEHCSLVVRDAVSETAAALSKAGATSDDATTSNTIEAELLQKDGGRLPAESRFCPLPSDDGEFTGTVGAARDVSDRKQREHQLERYERIVETVDDGIYILDSDHEFTMVNSAFAAMTGYDRDELLGSHGSLVFGEKDIDIADRKQAELEANDETVAVLEETLYPAERDPYPVESRFALFEFTDDDRGRIGTVRDISERKQREHKLERQRERLLALNDLNGVVRTITDAVIEQSTREEIEQVVCETIAATDSYLTAWVGEAEIQSTGIRLRASAGDGEGHERKRLPPDDTITGPAGRALRTNETQVTRTGSPTGADAQSREHARATGVEASAAIPIVHEEIAYGVLTVATDRSDAFSGDERVVLSHLGEVIGHAIAAVEQRRALTSDEVVELEFHLANLFEVFDPTETGDGRVTFPRTVPTGDDGYLQYGTAPPEMLDVLDSLVESIDHWRAVRVLGDAPDGRKRIELRLDDPDIISAVIAHGGYVGQVAIDNGDFTMEIHVAPSTDVRRLIEVIQDAYPMGSLTTRRQVPRDPDVRAPFSEPIHERLTDRQRAALESAYFAGYFEWPRPVTGEELAEAFGVSSPTFHHHLRNAQRKTFGIVLDDTDSR